MKTTPTKTNVQLSADQNMFAHAAVLLTASLCMAWTSAKADNSSDAPPAIAASTKSSVASSSYVTGSPTYTVKKYITLDGLMKEVYPNSPLHGTILSKALQSANPKLLNGKASQMIQRGVTLSIPNHTQLVVETLTSYAPPSPVAVVSPPSETNPYGSQSSDPSARRLWVRFP
jgi:hypothetical protein